jgi:hypothetical protein
MKRPPSILSVAILASLLAGCGGGNSGGSGGGGGTPPGIPMLTAIAPSSAAAGSAAITLAVYGSNFAQGAAVQWNGATLSGQWISATEMTATVPAADLSAAGSANVTVVNQGSGGGTSATQIFKITAVPATTTWVRAVPNVVFATNATPYQAANTVWDPAHGQLYLAIPSTASVSPNTIAIIDPIAGTATYSAVVGNNPDLLSISSDYSYLWVGLDGDHAVQRLLLPGLTKDISFPVPQSLQAIGLEAAPASPHTVALLSGAWDNDPGTDNVYVYDDSAARPNYIPGPTSTPDNMLWIQWGANASTLYGSSYNGGVSILNVTSSGVTFGSFNGQQPGDMDYAPMQYDSGTGLLYAYTLALNPANGSEVGQFNIAPLVVNGPIGQAACTSDSSLGRYFCVLSAPGSDVPSPVGWYELWVFNLSNYALVQRVCLGGCLSPSASPITGAPQHLVRWGNAGLALTTETWLDWGNGGFFLIDGAGVNPNVSPDVASGATTWPYSWLSSMSPQQAIAGSSDVTLTINGSNFTPDSTVYLARGPLVPTYLPTTYVSSNQLVATITADWLASPGTLPISVYDSSSGLYSSDTLAFTITSPSVSGSTTQVNPINLGGFALASSPTSNLVYAATTDVDGLYPNSVVAINGQTGTIAQSQPVSNNPFVLALSAGAQYLYVGYYGATILTQLPLPAMSPPVVWSLSNPSSSDVYVAGDIKAAPVSPHTTAVTLFNMNLWPVEDGGLVIYDDNVQRPDYLGGWGSSVGPGTYFTLAWGPTDEVLTAAGEGGPLFGLQASPTGVTYLATGSDNSFNQCGGEIHSDFGTGLIYSDCGNVADPTTLATVGSYNASGLLVPDSSLNRTFILGQTSAQANTNNYTIESFDQKAFTPVSSITLNNLQGIPFAFSRWGASGLAVLMETDLDTSVPGMLYLIQDSTFVSNAPVAKVDVSKRQELVQQRWKRVTKRDLLKKMLQARRAARN